VKSFDRQLLDDLLVDAYRQFALLSIHADNPVPTVEPFADIVGVITKLETASVIEVTFIGFAMDGQYPTVRVDLLWDSGQLWGL